MYVVHLYLSRKIMNHSPNQLTSVVYQPSITGALSYLLLLDKASGTYADIPFNWLVDTDCDDYTL